MEGENFPVEASDLPARVGSTASKVIPIEGLDNKITPLVRRAGRAPTLAAMTRWFRAMKAAGIPQAWVHYPDGTKLEFRATVQEVETDTWAEVA